MKEFFRLSDGSLDGTKFAGMILWSVAGIFGLVCLTGCGSTIKTAEYNFNQGTPAEVASAQGVRTISAAGASVAGGKGNTVIIVEEVRMDTDADGAISSGQGMAGRISDAVSSKLTDLSKENSDNPVSTTTTTTNQTTTTTEPVAPVVEPVTPDPVTPVEPVTPIEEID